MRLTKLFKSEQSNDKAEQSTLQLSVAVILFRLIRSDGQAKMLELVHMSELLRKEFSLNQSELEAVFELASNAQSNDIDALLKELSEDLPQKERIKLLEYLWRLAFTDDRIDDSEVELINKAAKQLGLSEIEKVTAQENAEKHLGLDLFQ